MIRDSIEAADGGIVSVDWANDKETQKLPFDAPIIGILHTLTGSSKEQSGFMSYAASRGYRSCVFNRRGHSGMPLTTIPSYNVMGNIDDTVLMVGQVRKCYPNSFFCLAGISAGSGQLVSFLGREGANANVDAAASLCPAYDLTTAFSLLKRCSPWLDRYLTKSIKRMIFMKDRNQELLSKHLTTVYNCLKQDYMIDFMSAAAPLAGYKDGEDFMKHNNPIDYCYGNQTPLFILSSLDDNICRKENIRYDLKDKVSNALLLVTDYGGHIAYNESGYPGNYMWRVTMDYFETVRACGFKRPVQSST